MILLSGVRVASVPVLGRLARRQPSFEPENGVLELQHPFFPLEFLTFAEVFE